jgi:CRP/FNR family transcriptional regulator, cyclic AMP receptor protein
MPLDLSHKGVLEALNSSRWLARLGPQVLEELAARGRKRKLADGEMIAARGKQPEGLALVISGAIRSSTFSEDGREIVFSLVRAGNVWGLVAVLDRAGAVHDTRASGPTELFVIPTAVIHEILERHPEVYREITLMLCYRMRKAYSAVDELGLANLRQRLARQLCTLVAQEGQAPADEQRVPVTQDELAALVGATRPSVNRELTAMEREGLVKKSYGGITVLAYEQLRGLCATRHIFDL